jgi:hypothetical protein
MPSSTRVDQHPHWNAQPDATQALGAYQEYGMSNGQDIALHFLPLSDDKCPTLATVLDALAAHGPQYAKNGDTLYPGVTLVDADNGLVHIAAADAKAPGQQFCASPAAAKLDPAGKGHATIDYNTAFAAGADRGLGMWTRVLPVKAQDSAARPWTPDMKADWLPGAWSIGNEFADWPAVIDHVLNHWQLPR